MKNKVKLILFLLTFSALTSGQKEGIENEGKSFSFKVLKNADIGVLTKTGSATINKNELEIVAGGADIWGKHDEFNFSYTELNGDFDLSVRIKSLSAAHLYTKSGIMARANMSDSSQHVYLQVFPDNSPRNKNNGGCEFQYRTTDGADMKAIYPDLKTAGNQYAVAFPNTWLRLKRQGDVFYSYFSNDNKNWKLYTSFTLKMPQKLLVGLAVTSHNSNDYTKSVFEGI